MPILLTSTPCIGKCDLGPDKERCLGCGRLRVEIKAWKSMAPEERHDVNMRLLVTQGKKVRKRILRDVAKALGRAP
ncbi:MAG: DUF1289 domain-containing protein [Comamonadaceae bacterium]|nr:MAG: DUF1289 domain-containing protein [Comamonadaceae bacterium]